MEANFKELPINPDRFCEGISKIGYKPAAALMDIVDNSVAAGANHVQIELVTRAGTTNSSAGNVELFRISDDGIGMSEDQIETALEIGSDVEYPKNSLSKFGFGLKSAGFSLGRRIEVTSRSAGQLTASRFVDRDIIRDRRQYGICAQEPPAGAETWLTEVPSGTVIEISKTAPNQESAAKIRKELQKRLGVTYFNFLSRSNSPLSISIKVGADCEEVKPLDILFWATAADGFDPDTYDGKTPCKIYDGTVGDDLFASEEKVQLQITVFPMDRMKGYPAFSDEEKKRVASYAVSRENSGFFFYRNGRLIRWGDKVAGVTRDDIGFRARVSFTTAHDELFHVDVSKQNLELSEDFEQKLSLLCRTPLGDAREAFAICKRLLSLGTGVEGEAFNIRTDVFEESDPIEDIEPAATEVKVERRAILETETRDRETKEGDEPEITAPAGAAETPIFERVRYSDKVIGLDVSVPGTDRTEGTYVRINKNHPFYDLVISHFDPSDPARLAIESLLWAGAVAETKTCENVSKLTYDELKMVFEHFRRVFSQNLNTWSSVNQDLFG